MSSKDYAIINSVYVYLSIFLNCALLGLWTWHCVEIDHYSPVYLITNCMQMGPWKHSWHSKKEMVKQIWTTTQKTWFLEFRQEWWCCDASTVFLQDHKEAFSSLLFVHCLLKIYTCNFFIWCSTYDVVYRISYCDNLPWTRRQKVK